MNNISILIPLSWDFVPKHFMLSLWNMSQFSLSRGVAFNVYTCNDPDLYKAREKLAQLAKTEGKDDFFLWLDADQTYPEDTALKLMEAFPENPSPGVIGGVTPHRGTWQTHTYMLDEKEHAKYHEIKLNSGPVKIEAMGYGGIMTPRCLFEELKPPYFLSGIEQKDWGLDYIGEDIYFYRQCKRAGIPVYVDSDLHFNHLVYLQVNPAQRIEGKIE